MESWLLYALGAMLLLAGGNFAFKILAKDFNFANSLENKTVPIALIALACGAAIYFFVFPGASPAMLTWLAAAVLCSLFGYFLVIAALNTGKVALVGAVLSLSTIVLALLSIKFLGDSFTPMQAVAMLLAVCSIAILAF
ncbi:EamA-like transporter family protein [Candidatus Norongarragalina meridionalis]|nr:EamA-like transporter family protein [Candidatus Norongarragalina meridionalis]